MIYNKFKELTTTFPTGILSDPFLSEVEKLDLIALYASPEYFYVDKDLSKFVDSGWIIYDEYTDLYTLNFEKVCLA
jgi:hypothetical protein